MINFRCSNCNKLLGKVEGKAEIQCPRCKEINQLDTKTYPWGIGYIEVKPMSPGEIRKRYPTKLKFQDLLTKVPIFTKEEQERIEGKAEIKCPKCKTINIHKTEWFDNDDKCTKCGKVVGVEFHFAHANNCRNINPVGFVKLNEAIK